MSNEFRGNAPEQQNVLFPQSPNMSTAYNQASIKPQQQQQAQPQPGMWQLLGALLGGGQQQQPFDFNAAFAAMRNDPQHDRNVGYAPGVNNEHNPFSNGFFRTGASDLPAGAIARSQGGNAMNQWMKPGVFAWNQPGVQQAPPAPVARPFNNPAPLTGPQGTPQQDAANLLQNKALYKASGSAFGRF